MGGFRACGCAVEYIVCFGSKVEMFERGFGYGLTARRLGVAETVREW